MTTVRVGVSTSGTCGSSFSSSFDRINFPLETSEMNFLAPPFSDTIGCSSCGGTISLGTRL